MDAADVNETVCEDQCGGSSYIDNKTASINLMEGSGDINGMLSSLNDMCT